MWLEACVDHKGIIDWRGYELLTTRLPLRAFLEIQETATVVRDRSLAWDVWLSKNPKVLEQGAVYDVPEEGET